MNNVQTSDQKAVSQMAKCYQQLGPTTTKTHGQSCKVVHNHLWLWKLFYTSMVWRETITESVHIYFKRNDNYWAAARSTKKCKED